MSENKINDLVDLMFSFDSEKLEKETDLLKKYKELQKENEKYKEIINKVTEYINKYCEDYIIEDSPDEMCLFYNEDGTYKPEAKEDLLNILKGDENNE